MTRKNSSPRVKPVRKYNIARYPSHEDPDPINHPQPVNFPFRKELVATLATLGILGTKASLTENGSAKNPFTLEQSGLPHQPSMFGTGQPSYLADKKAREVIDRVFREEGFTLKSNVPYQEEDNELVLDGFDENDHTGYVLAHFKNLEKDALIPWSPVNPNSDPIDQLRSRLQYKVKNEFTGKIKEHAQRTLELTDEARFRKGFADLEKEIGRSKLSLKEARHLATIPTEKKEFIAVISLFDRRFHITRGSRKFDAATPKSADELKKTREEQVGEVLKNLEKSVRQYLEWARSQGL